MCAWKDAAMLQMLRPVGAPEIMCARPPQLALGTRHKRNPTWPQDMGTAHCPGQGDKTRDTCCMGMGPHHVMDMQETPVPPVAGVWVGFPR